MTKIIEEALIIARRLQDDSNYTGHNAEPLRAMDLDQLEAHLVTIQEDWDSILAAAKEISGKE